MPLHGSDGKLVHVAGKRAKLWATFNEPGVAAMCGWIAGNHPPGKLLHFRVSLASLLLSVTRNGAKGLASMCTALPHWGVVLRADSC